MTVSSAPRKACAAGKSRAPSESPRGEASNTSDFRHELPLQEMGAYGFNCVEAGTPGQWDLIHRKPTRGITDDFTAPPRDFYIGVTEPSKDIVVTLPSGANLADGFEMLVKDETGSAGGPYRIRVQAVAGEAVDGGGGAEIAPGFWSLRVMPRWGVW